MSVPSALRVGPFTHNILLKKRYIIFYIFLIWLSITITTIEFWLFWHFLWLRGYSLIFLILLPIILFFMYLTATFISLFFAKILLIIVNIIHEPREGVFIREKANNDYRFWCIRNIIKKWPIWLAHKFPFPFLDNISFKIFGVKTSLSNSLFEGWVDTEFIEFGENVIIGKSAIIQSSLIVGNLLIIKKTVIEDNSHIGSHTIVMPGTHVGKNCILAASSATAVDQILEDGWIYIGLPAKRYRLNPFYEDDLEDKLSFVTDTTTLQAKIYKTYEKGKFKNA
jgi:acetyltransferase-like isoleucine patch superfamily enzyme